MTYLNDVEDGGGTEFKYQGLRHNAKKGKTLIWPSDFTHTHRGQKSPTQEKYIATSWFNHVDVAFIRSSRYPDGCTEKRRDGKKKGTRK